MSAASLVRVKLRDLPYGAAFITVLTRRLGVVSATGWYPWDDGAGRTTRLRSVLVRYADGAEVIHRAGLLVLVGAEMPHARFTPADEMRRWSEQLHDPETMGTLRDLAKRISLSRAKPKGLPC